MARPARLADSKLVRIRAVIASVPRGRVITYGDAAAAAGFPGSARLTVRALRSSEHLPWHRVVAVGGRIALPGPDGREQRLRLEIEGVAFRGSRVRLDLHRWRPEGDGRRRFQPEGNTTGPPAKGGDRRLARWKESDEGKVTRHRFK